MAADEILRLSRMLGYEFGDPGLLRQALTHRSARPGHNERLEYLGDAGLNFVIADELYRRYPRAREGELSRRRARLVNEDSLAALARYLQLGDYLVLGAGERKSGGARRASILADAMEAVIGAVYLDGGFETMRDLVHSLYAEWLDADLGEEALKDPKTRLQEWLQGEGLPLPEYDLRNVLGEGHHQTFEVALSAAPFERPIIATGGSRRKAEQAAAAEALNRIAGSGNA